MSAAGAATRAERRRARRRRVVAALLKIPLGIVMLFLAVAARCALGVREHRAGVGHLVTHDIIVGTRAGGLGARALLARRGARGEGHNSCKQGTTHARQLTANPVRWVTQ